MHAIVAFKACTLSWSSPACLFVAGEAPLLDQANLCKLQYHFVMVVAPNPASLLAAGQAPLLGQANLCVLQYPAVATVAGQCMQVSALSMLESAQLEIPSPVGNRQCGCYISDLAPRLVVVPSPACLLAAGKAPLLDQGSLGKLQYHFITVIAPSPAWLLAARETPLLKAACACCSTSSSRLLLFCCRRSTSSGSGQPVRAA